MMQELFPTFLWFYRHCILHLWQKLRLKKYPPELRCRDQRFGIGVMELEENEDWRATNEGCFRCKKYWDVCKVGLTAIGYDWVCENCITEDERIIRRDWGCYINSSKQFAEIISDKAAQKLLPIYLKEKYKLRL